MIVHSLPDRLRLRHPALHDPDLLDRICRCLRTLDGVLESTGSASTGSILIRHTPSFSRKAALFMCREAIPALPAVPRRRPAPRRYHKAVKAGMGGLLGLSLALAAGGKEKGHIAIGLGFVACLAGHLFLNRNRLTF